MLVLGLLSTIFLYVKCKRKSSGSYNVYLRHSRVNQERDRVRIQSEYEQGTESVHSSFSNITLNNDEAHQVAGGVAELGCVGELMNEEGNSTLD